MKLDDDIGTSDLKKDRAVEDEEKKEGAFADISVIEDPFNKNHNSSEFLSTGSIHQQSNLPTEYITKIVNDEEFKIPKLNL